MRWNHPSRGLLYPESFLGLAREAGLMQELTRVVLEKALDQAAVWQATSRPMPVSVKLPAASLLDEDLPGKIGAMIEGRALSPSVLLVEVTEEDVMADFDRALASLTRLRALGIRIVIDNFGTGHTSLAQLRRLPVDELKLDLSFVIPMADDAHSAALVASTVTLAPEPHAIKVPLGE